MPRFQQELTWTFDESDDGEIVGWLHDHPGDHSGRAIQADLGLPAWFWREAIRRLVDSGAVIRTGHGPGTRYALNPDWQDSASDESPSGSPELKAESNDVVFLDLIAFGGVNRLFEITDLFIDDVLQWFLKRPGWHSWAKIRKADILPCDLLPATIAELEEGGHLEHRGSDQRLAFRLVPEDGEHLLLDWLQQNPGWHDRKEVLTALAALRPVSRWTGWINRLVKARLAESTREGRTTLYRAR